MNFNWVDNIPKYDRWTQTAILCYKRGGNCRGCPIKEIIESRCLMKYTAVALVKQLGRPKGQ